MFKLNPAPTFKATVDVSQPGDAPSLQLEVVFRHRGRAELVALMDDIANSKQAGKTDAEALGQIIETWVDVVDADGAAVPYSSAALDRLLDAYPAAGADILRAYWMELTKAKQKNS